MPEGVKFTQAVVYGHVDGRDLTADIITPVETPLEPRPALVSLHGGSWMAGSPGQFHFHSAYFAAKYGIFGMGVDYRLSGEAPFPAALQDAKCAIRWIRAHATELNIDPNRIAIIGGSAGGHLSSMVATTAGVPEYEGNGGNAGFSSHVNLAILINGEFDMWDLVEKKSLIEPMRVFMGGTPEQVPERYDELSSVKRIHEQVPPVLLLHGTHDLCVSHEQSLAFRDRCLEKGVHAEAEIYQGKPHAWFNREPDRTIVLRRIEEFLVRQFRLGPVPDVSGANADTPDPGTDREAFRAWQKSSRARLRHMLGIPEDRVPLDPECRGQFLHDGLVIEKWIFTAEPGTRVPAVLYRPEPSVKTSMPCVVLTYGHGGSKSQPDYQYPAQCFAKVGIACLAIDPLGEEERHITGGMGTRAHDPEAVHLRAQAAGRLIMGKFVWDTMRGIDFVLERDDIDVQRIGVAGNSLGGAVAGWVAALDWRLNFAVISGWAFSPKLETYGKFCTRVPNVRMRETGLTWDEYLALAAPYCAVRIVNGDADVVIDQDGRGEVWRDTDRAVAAAEKVYASLGKPGDIQTWYEPDGGHRPYPAQRVNLEWLVDRVRPTGWSAEKVRALPETNFGQWCQKHGFNLEKLYGTQLHLLGATVTDLNVIPLNREQLAVLRLEEIGEPQYTIEGWLDRIEREAVTTYLADP
jgi:acetyl esterase/lipase